MIKSLLKYLILFLAVGTAAYYGGPPAASAVMQVLSQILFGV